MDNMESSCSPSGDNKFGPAVAECLRSFDFTLLFEESILSILPCTLLLLLFLVRLFYLSRRRVRVVTGKVLQNLKVGFIVIYVVIKLVLLVLWSKSSLLQRTPTATPSATLDFITAIALCILSYFEHSRSIRPSALIALYILCSMVCDAIRARTLWLMKDRYVIAVVFTSSLAVKAVVLLLEATDKRAYLSSKYGSLGPEETSGIFSKSFVFWASGLLLSGNRSILSLDSLSPIHSSMHSWKLETDFNSVWERSTERGSYTLHYALLKTLWWSTFEPVLPRLVTIALTFAQPLLLADVVNFLSQPVDTKTSNAGSILIVAYAVLYLGIAISTSLYQQQLNRLLTKVRGVLVSVVYSKTLEMRVKALDDSAAVTLMSVDVERIVNGLRSFHDLWAALVEGGMAAWLLQRNLGIAFIAPILLFLVSAGAGMILAGSAGKRQAWWMAAVQNRISKTSKMLGEMHGVKITGVTEILYQSIAKLRIDELSAASKFRYLLLWNLIAAFVPKIFSPVVAFGGFLIDAKRHGGNLDIARLFSSLSLLGLLTQPITTLLAAAPQLMAAIACLSRVQKYLLSEKIADLRFMSQDCSPQLRPSTSTPPSDSSQSNIREKNVHFAPLSLKTLAAHKIDIPRVEISVKEGSFRWTPNGPLIIQRSNIQINSSQIVMVVGNTGSGKSTFLKSLLGETLSEIRSISVAASEIAYCDQVAWLANATARENIVTFSEFDNGWYNEVVRCCVLEEDFAQLPQGDESMLGSKGITLSGGQKQRVAIARAVYSRKKVAIFDDVLSGLDPTTQTKLFDRLLGPEGLLRKQGTTVVLATHAVKFLPFADHIIVLGDDGAIAEQGSFEHLHDAAGYIERLGIQQASTVADSNSIKEDVAPDRPTKSTTLLLESKPKTGEPKVKQDITRQIGDVAVYRYYFSATGWVNVTVFFVLQLIWAAFTNFPLVWLQMWSSANEKSSSANNASYMSIYTLFQVLSFGSLVILGWHLFINMQVSSGKMLHLRILNTVMNAPMSFFGTVDTGITTNRFTQDIQLVDAELPFALLNTVASGLTLLWELILVLPASYWLAISYPLLFGVLYLIQRFYLRTSRQVRLLDLEAKSPLFTHFMESIDGLITIRAYGLKREHKRLNHQLLDDSQRPFYLMLCIQRWLNLVLNLTVAGLATTFMALVVELKESTSIAFTGVALYNLMSIGAAMQSTVLDWTQLETSIGAVSRIKTFEEETASEHLAGEIVIPPPTWPDQGNIIFRNITASYGSESQYALQNFSISIKAGERIGICGRSGSGKSTLLLTLFRMIELCEGSIIVDNVDLKTVPRNYIRSHIHAIPQEPFFLSRGSIRLNMDFENSRSDQQIIEALKRVKLWDIIESKGGLDTEMTDSILSQGQRQIFCLARAILCHSRIVVLDEATSSVDADTDKSMQRIIRSEFRNRTVIVIAHRIETILDFDRIAVLDNGSMVECDTPSVLLSRTSALKDLYEQMQG